MRILVLILYLSTTVVATLDIAMVRSKLSICKDFDVLSRDDTNMLIRDIHECMVDTRLFRISEEVVDRYFRGTIDRYKNALREYDILNHKMIHVERDSRQTLRSIQRSIVGVRMNVLYLIAESNIPPLSHLSNEREIRRVREYLISNAKTLEYLKSVPMLLYIGRMQNITYYADELASSVELRDTSKRDLENTKKSFTDLILSQFVL